MIPRGLPDYVEQGGRQVYRPPYIAMDAKLSCFAVDGNRQAIDDLLDRDLNEPAGGDLHYRCASERVFFVFAKIPELTSRDAPDSDFGYVSENELSIWCLAADVSGSPRLVWYLPYVFTDRGQAVATGREVYGYPKQSARVVLDDGQNAGHSAEAWAIDTYGANTPAALQLMVTAPSVGGLQPFNSANSISEVFADIANNGLQVAEGVRPGGAPVPSATITIAGTPPLPPAKSGAAWLRTPMGLLANLSLATLDTMGALEAMFGGVRVVFLKQFRDVECPTKACYQAVVEANINVVALHGAQMLETAGQTVTVHQYDSHPLAHDLLGESATTTRPCQAAFTVNLDFLIDTGVEVWRAPT